MLIPNHPLAWSPGLQVLWWSWTQHHATWKSLMGRQLMPRMPEIPRKLYCTRRSHAWRPWHQTSNSEGWSESEGVTSTCSWSQILRSRSYALVSQRIRPNLSKETRLEISIQRNETRSLLVEWVAKQIWDTSKKAVTWGLVGVFTSSSYPLRTSECDLVWK